MFNLEQTRKKAQFEIALNEKALLERLKEKYSDTSNRTNVYMLRAIAKAEKEGLTVNIDRTQDIKNTLLNLIKDKTPKNRNRLD